jgi:carbamoyltransferase
MSAGSERDVCVSGGVGLNCLMNTAIAKVEGVRSVYVPPAPQDQGQCIGNAVWAARELGMDLTDGERLFLGRPYALDNQTVERMCVRLGLSYQTVRDPAEVAVSSLTNGDVIGWFQGGSEFGPRALGNRSILADPRDRLVRDRLNLEIKRRESFRPFAPSVLDNGISGIFTEFDGSSPSMMFVAEVKRDVADRIPSVTHVDGTARLQTVRYEDNPTFHDLIEGFGAVTGLPVVLNTSFNVDRMPIVETPLDALECFAASNLDAMVMGDYYVKR